jgi:apolipoprotein N-acyltransferase
LGTRPPTAIAVIAGLLLAAYLVLVVRALLSPSSDPQRGMANGFLMMVTLFLLCLAGLLWYGTTRHRAGPVWTVFAICALPSLSFVARAVYLLVRWVKGAS